MFRASGADSHRVALALLFYSLVQLGLAACGSDDGSATGPIGPGSFASVTAGEDHTCALTGDGAAYCWGLNRNGQLGDRSTVDRDRPVGIAGDQRFSSLSAGNSHTCGLTSTGAAFCWGRNSEGQVGDATLSDRLEAVPVAGDLRYLRVSPGGIHTCAIRSGGTPHCWGSAASGQLGIGISGLGVIRSAPVTVSGGLSMSAISAGGAHTCGIVGNGDAYCWGSDRLGVLGTSEDEMCDDGLGNLFPCSATPVPVSGGLKFASVSAGVSHTCGITESGAAYCWGRNAEGQLGNGSSTTATTPVPVSGGIDFAGISVGAFDSCGWTAEGAAYCWGMNHRGQIGDGTTENRSTPTLVSGGIKFVSLAAGGVHNCGLTASGALYCWGANRDGQLGVGPTAETCNGSPCSKSPVRVELD